MIPIEDGLEAIRIDGHEDNITEDPNETGEYTYDEDPINFKRELNIREIKQ
jgi:hypothetical protein